MEKKAQFHEDDRRASIYDIFGNKINGQLNISYARDTTTVVAWHKHNIQYDRWMCIKGAFKVGLATYEGTKWKTKTEYLSEKNLRWITISPGVWHGWRALEKDSIMLYYLDQKYSHPPDEEKIAPTQIPFQWETESK
jgi:dTDP-4-dehydrorhamnose 3,5-epimerase-like enzyme